MFLALGLFSFAGVALADTAPDPALLAKAKVSESAARAKALAKVSGGTVSSSELENEHGKLIWSFDIAQPKSTSIVEIQVDAKTGGIVSRKVESAAKEAHEAVMESKETHASHKRRAHKAEPTGKEAKGEAAEHKAGHS